MSTYFSQRALHFLSQDEEKQTLEHLQAMHLHLQKNVLTQSSIWSGVIVTPMPQLFSKEATSTGKTGLVFIYSTAAKQ